MHFSSPPQRVVSLVPSLTESLFDLGLGEVLVGITDYCAHPAGELEGLPRLGGTKNPRVEQILELKPDLVLANWEENHLETVEALEDGGLQVWVTFPRSVQEALEVLWTVARLFHSQMATMRLKTLEMTLDWTVLAASERQPRPYFCPIWYGEEAGQPWWMTFNGHTYCHDLLKLLGGQNVFAERERRYPLKADLGKGPPQDPQDRDTRYPRVTLDEVIAAAPELILLPSEPYAFDESHQEQILALLADTPAAQKGQVQLVDGSLVTWHGTRLARALSELPAVMGID